MTIWNILFILFVGGAAIIAVASGVALKLRGDRAAFNADFQRAHFYKGSAVAISTARSLVRLKAGRASKTYSFSDVRSWEKHWHNSRHEGTLTLSVRDIDLPVWTIRFGNEAEMNRWYEIVGQAINEKLKL